MTYQSTSPSPSSGTAEDTRPRLDPAILFRTGTFDAWAVLGVWYVRKLFVPVLWIGMMVAIIADPRHVANISLESPEDTWHALLSPLAGIVIAIALRVGANFAALLLALPASAAVDERLQPRVSLGRRIGTWSDRLNVASAFRALRWTYDARQFAIERLDTHGRAFATVDRGFVAANVLLPVVTIAVSVVISG